MAFQRKQHAALLALTAGWLLAATAQGPARRASASATSSGNLVPLRSGSCVTVVPGDTVTLDWNPTFDHAEAVVGLREISLLFARAGEENSARRGHGGLRLQSSSSHAQQSQNASRAVNNGQLQVTFRPDLSAATNDNYYLVQADAVPSVTPGYEGQLPAMTNDPVRSSYCIVVTAAASSQ